jgi:HD superfamily phosphodiesterase
MANEIEELQHELLRRAAVLFGADQERIGHAVAVLKYAGELLREEQADPYVVFPAAVFLDAGSPAAEQKYGSAPPEQHEKEGPRVAGEILVDMGYEHENIVEICAIIAHHHHPLPSETVNFKVVYDADRLATLRACAATVAPAALRHMIETGFLTSAGGERARTFAEKRAFLPEERVHEDHSDRRR